jgi:hypothetical protein
MHVILVAVLLVVGIYLFAQWAIAPILSALQ